VLLPCPLHILLPRYPRFLGAGLHLSHLSHFRGPAQFVVAASVSILLGFSPKLGALILSIPGPVIGGLSIVLFGLIAAMAGRIWVENNVDFSNPRNLITVAAALTAGAGDLTLKFGAFTMGGIGTATFGAIILYQILALNSATQQRPRSG
jgi:xanthine/uracil permease